MSAPDLSLLKDPSNFANPFPAYDALRPHSPLQVSRVSWILLSYEHVRAALADSERFSSNVRASDNPVFRNSPLVFDDPPRHTQIRRIINKAFTPRRVIEAEPWVRTIADELLDQVGDEPADFVPAYCDPLPVFVIARMMGIPTDRFRDFKVWSEARSFVIYNSRGERTPALIEAEQHSQAIEDWFAALIGERAARPGDDLISALITAEVDGERLDPGEIVGTCCVLLSAGNLTTTRLMGSLLRVLGSDEPLWQRVQRERELVPLLVEEVVRLESPVQTPIRRTVVDVEMGGKTIPAGAFVTIGIGAANRDPAAYVQPDEIALARDQPHLAFGHGIHFCLGAALARLEARVALEALLDRYESFTTIDAVQEATGLAHRGLARLSARAEPRRGR